MDLSKIETDRLLLREWKIEDAEDLLEGLCDFDVTKNLTIPYPYTKEHAINFINAHIKNTVKDCTFAIVLKETNKVIGGTSIEYYEDINQYKGGIWFNKKYIGKGFGTEAWIARAKFAFEVLKVNELVNGFFEFNNASKHMQEKVGYKITGKKKNYSPALKQEVVEITTLLTKEDFYNKIKK
ncbi:MAG: GNAT family N-acetyltransferase [Clostridia bacterium]|nr:GNAT family N-acetyltransferase [Clostridia bacterium]